MMSAIREAFAETALAVSASSGRCVAVLALREQWKVLLVEIVEVVLCT